MRGKVGLAIRPFGGVAPVSIPVVKDSRVRFSADIYPLFGTTNYVVISLDDDQLLVISQEVCLGRECTGRVLLGLVIDSFIGPLLGPSLF